MRNNKNRGTVEKLWVFNNFGLLNKITNINKLNKKIKDYFKINNFFRKVFQMQINYVMCEKITVGVN